MIQAYKDKLDSLRKVYLGIKILCLTTLPEHPVNIKDKYFKFMNAETARLIIGRIYILIADKKHNSYNTISFKILVDEILKSINTIFPDTDNENIIITLENIQEEISNIDKKYEKYRNKRFAHIELTKENQLFKINELNITNRDIYDLVKLAEKIYDELFLILEKSSSDHMKREIDQLSQRLWTCYEKEGLVEKIK